MNTLFLNEFEFCRMFRYKMQLSYNGARYFGWQRQPNAVSVQEMVENALSTLLRNEIAVTGAGRTDTGVHALFYILHFDFENEIENPADLVYHLNRFLPDDIAIQNIRKTSADFHARYSAVSRTYKYFIASCKDPFNTGSAYLYTKPLDIDKMNEAAKLLFEYHDFTSFSKLHSDVKTNYCRVYEAFWVREGDLLVFTIKADRFLRNMVRAIAGTLIEVGKGKINDDGFRNIIEKKDRCAAGTSIPAHGLFLVDIEYPEEV